MKQFPDPASTRQAVPRELQELYKHPLPSSRGGPLFNAFSYPTKISPEAVALYIATHTRPGATVLDAFAGSGTTGLAAHLCDRPTREMRQLAAVMGLNPVWGPRHAVLYELGVIGSFVAEVMCHPPDPHLFEQEAAALVHDGYAAVGGLLAVADDRGCPGVLRHAIWSDVLLCPHCGHEQSFWEVAVCRQPLRLREADEPHVCPACATTTRLGAAGRATEVVFDELLGQSVERRKRVPVRIHGRTGTRKWQREVLPSDLELLRQVDAHPLPASTPVAPLKLGDLYRSGYHFGMTHLHHLYTRRNLISVATLLELVERRDARVRDALRLLVLSYNQSHATLMTRVVVKSGQTDFVLTGAQSGVLYVSSLPVEKNVIDGIARKVKPLRDSFALVRDSRSTVVVRNRSSTALVEGERSIDYVFTDPPFADFIPYAEINQVNDLWLGRRTDDADEAVVSAAQGKSLGDYEHLMTRVFSELGRVLKDEGKATVVFHAAKASVWAALQRAYRRAGFEVAAASVLDKLQASFKQVVSTVSVKGDPLLLLTKEVACVRPRHSGEALIAELLAQARRSGDAAEHAPSRLYSRYVNRCLGDGVAVEFDAEKFYAMLQAAAQ